MDEFVQNIMRDRPHMRPVLALVGVVVRHCFTGVADFAVTLYQLGMGWGLMFLASRWPKLEWTRNFFVFPIGVVVMASLAAIPIWLFTEYFGGFVGNLVRAMNMPHQLAPVLVFLAAQMAACFYGAVWVALKIAEHLGNEAAVKRLSRLLGT